MGRYGLDYQGTNRQRLFSACVVVQTLILVLYTVSTYPMVRFSKSHGDIDCTRLENVTLLLMTISLIVNTQFAIVTIRIRHKLFTQKIAALAWFSVQVILAFPPVGLIIHVLGKGELIQTHIGTWFPAISISVLVAYIVLLCMQWLLLFIKCNNTTSDMELHGNMDSTQEKPPLLDD